ncbi:MAG: polyribonucleotide nucleotidyltransferase [Buchnera aphidicola (Eriosoma harunire)]
MLTPIIRKFQYGKHIVTIETGILARQATAAVMVSIEDTSVLVTVVADQTILSNQKYFPLSVNYQERAYASGKIPGSFFRREGRPSENETLIARLIDRPIRPLFPKYFLNNIQIVATVVSFNPKVKPDIVAIIGASAALMISGLPFQGPIAAARVGYINNRYVLNPSYDELKNSTLDLIISGTKNAVLMVEASADVLTEDIISEAISFGHMEQQVIIDNIQSLYHEVNPKLWEYPLKSHNQIVLSRVSELAKVRINDAYTIIEKKNRFNELNLIKLEVVSKLLQENLIISELEVDDIFYEFGKNIVRNRILNGELRIDGRTADMIRPLDIRVGILPRTHGSSLFTRGETQALVSITLGTSRDAQNIDDLLGDRVEYFLFHYNFPPYSVGEIGIIGSPKRREIGHGSLAKRSLLAVMPSMDFFPYTVRIVSEITESNGSSSMASVCGASLALMDAGVPIKSPIAGIAMGLIKKGDKYVILSDILGDEDHLGDMDFKVAGSELGITCLQMDMKIEGINNEIIKFALLKAKSARLHILSIMGQVLNTSRKEISDFAPRIYKIHINPEKIKDLIGKGGSVIRMLTEETGTVIEIEDNGIVKISATIKKQAQIAIAKIKVITSDIEVGEVYLGKVTRIVDFGAFVSIGIGKEGLVHISQITDKRVDKVTDYLSIHQQVSVKVLEVDRQGRLRLSLKDNI